MPAYGISVRGLLRDVGTDTSGVMRIVIKLTAESAEYSRGLSNEGELSNK